MDKKRTILLTITIIVSLLITIVSTAYAYFETLASTNEDFVNVTSTTNAESSAFLAMGGPISLSISLNSMSENESGNQSYKSVSSNTEMSIIFGSAINDKKMSCTYDLVYVWEEDSDKYLSGTPTPPTTGIVSINNGKEFTITVGDPVYSGTDKDSLDTEDLTRNGMEETNIYYSGTCSDDTQTTEMDCIKEGGEWTLDESGLYANQMVLINNAIITAKTVYNSTAYCTNSRYDNRTKCLDAGEDWLPSGGGIKVEWPIIVRFYNLPLDQTKLAGRRFAGHVEVRNVNC